MAVTGLYIVLQVLYGLINTRQPASCCWQASLPRRATPVGRHSAPVPWGHPRNNRSSFDRQDERSYLNINSARFRPNALKTLNRCNRRAGNFVCVTEERPQTNAIWQKSGCHQSCSSLNNFPGVLRHYLECSTASTPSGFQHQYRVYP